MSPKSQEIEPKLDKVTMRVRRSRPLFPSSRKVGLYFGPKARQLNVLKFFLCAFHCTPRSSGFSLESARLENIPKVPKTRAEVRQNHDARKAVSATLLVLK